MNFFYRITLLTTSIIISFMACTWISETFFFDKLYYQKSIRHGYWRSDLDVGIEDYGARANDIRMLDEFAQNKAQTKDTLGVQSDNVYTVALIGDSYVWGVGVTYEQTLPVVLESRLNKLRKSRVISLARSGDDIIDHLSKYQDAQTAYSPDLYIIVLLSNDHLFNNPRWRAFDLYKKLTASCKKKTGSPAEIVDFTLASTSKPNFESELRNKFQQSLKNPTNLCVFDIAMEQLPKENAIYFFPEEYVENNPQYDPYRDALEKNGLFSLNAQKGQGMKQYAHYWENPQKYLQISKKENHPSARAYQMYADLLVEEIKGNPSWKFFASP